MEGIEAEKDNAGLLIGRPELDEMFRYHAPKPGQGERYIALRAAAKQFAIVLCQTTPIGADQSAALRKIREAVMTGNAAIALE